MLGHLPCFLQVPPTCPATTSKDTPIQRWRGSSTCLRQPPPSLPEASGEETSPGSLPEQVWPEQPVSPCHDVRLSLPARSRRTGGGCIAWCHTAAPAGTVQPTQLSSPSHHLARPPGSSPEQDTALRTSQDRGTLHPDTEQELGAPSPRVCRQRGSREMNIGVWLQTAAHRAPFSLSNQFLLPSGKRRFPGK